jgi:hypothetical protein
MRGPLRLDAGTDVTVNRGIQHSPSTEEGVIGIKLDTA